MPVPKNLRILHAIDTVNPATGGPLEGVKLISKVNQSYGHKAEVLCLDAPDDPWVQKLGFQVHAMGPGLLSYHYTPRLVPWLKANHQNYDVVIVNGIWNYNTFGVWRALRGTDTPYFVYTHGMLDPYFKYRYPLKYAKKWLMWPWSVFPVLQQASGVMFTCEEERRLARKTFWLYDCNEIVVNYGTPGAPDPELDYGSRFLEKHPHLKPFRRFVFLGRVHPKKGPDIILRTLARLRKNGAWDPDRMKLIMAGPADGAYAASLQKLARELNIEKSVEWTGMLLGDDKWGALQCAECFLLPSHQENFGIAVAESLSVGVPVLISTSVNIWSDIVHDGAGIADDDTVDGCERQLRAWFGLTEAARRAMAEKARVCFEQRYTAKRAAVSMLSNVFQVIHAKRRLVSSRG